MTQAGSSDKDKSDADLDASTEENATESDASSEPLILSEEDEASENKDESDDEASDEGSGGSDGSEDTVEDAEVIEETNEEIAADSDEPSSDGEESDPVTDDEAITEDEIPVSESEAEIETEQEPEVEPVAATAPPPPAQSNGAGGFIALVLGGVGAALIGYLVAQYTGPEGNSAEVTEALAAQSERMASLEAELATATTALADLPSKDDLAAVADDAQSGDSDLQSAIGAASDGLAAVEERLNALGEELAVVAARPIPEAFDAAALDEELRGFRADLSSAIETAKEDIAAARAEAETIRAEADAGKAEAAVGALLVDLQSALETGQPFSDIADGLTSAGVDVPEALSTVAGEGVETLASLADGFPSMARQALTASIQSSTPESTGDRLMAFLRVQSGARSLAPRDGDDPDAVLSRIEAAVGSGDLDTALNEVGSLPDAGQAELASWVATATTRRDALAAAEALQSATMN